MINGLRGNIQEKNTDSITLEVNGVGYKIFINNSFLNEINNISNDQEVYVYTYLSVRENSLDLYGFENKENKQLFKLLLTVSGIGPKSAMNIMNSVTREMIEESISKEDAKYLSKVSGIGKKTAEKILIGLKDKIEGITLDISKGQSRSDNSLAIEALVSIGYTERDSREAVRAIDTKDKNTQEIIKEALNKLN